MTSIKKRWGSRLRTWFLAGLAVVVPAVFTLNALVWLWQLADRVVAWPQRLLLGHTITGVGVLTALLLVLGMGAVATHWFGRRMIAWVEGVVMRLPLVRAIYSVSRQIMEALVSGNQQAFQRVALLEYPRHGVYTLGFVTGEVAAGGGRRLVSLFVPTTPNPTSGWYLVVAEDEVVFLGMTVEEGLQLIISGGVLRPSATGRSELDRAVARLVAIRERVGGGGG